MVGGSLGVIRSRLFLPALQQRSGIESSGPPPILVAALAGVDTPVVATIEQDHTKGPSALKESLRGRVKVKTPRNLWLTGRRFQAEISGDIDLAFTGGEPLIAGYADIMRGYFEVASVRLNFEESRVWFTGADNFNPTLDITSNISSGILIAARELWRSRFQGKPGDSSDDIRWMARPSPR